MKSNPSPTSKTNLESSLLSLFPKGPTKTAEKIYNAGVKTLQDLLWIFPLRVYPAPQLASLDTALVDYRFHGIGKILSVNAYPNYRVKGKGKAVLYNISAFVKDVYSDQTILLKWFNSYSSVKKKLEDSSLIEYQGKVSEYQEKLQILTPIFTPIQEESIPNIEAVDQRQKELVVQYPTVSGVSGSLLKKIIDKLPPNFWDNIEETIPEKYLEERNLMPFSEALKTIHGKTDVYHEDILSRAKDRIIYQEFFHEQVRIKLRKMRNQKLKSIRINPAESSIKNILKVFPYQLTPDQESCLLEIKDDLKASFPMMRLIQGDVGSGKTSIAIAASLMVNSCGHQAAIMCPTESLALQHFLNISEMCKKRSTKVALLLGSTSAKEKKVIGEDLASGKIDIIIGTHSLIQKKVLFKSLALAIIDEQHKFGVNQRLQLINKSEGCHCLIMTATPIPRSLSLTQFGDLSISSIKSMPLNRKGHKTRIVTPENFDKFLSFLKTRISMGEQGYIVVPAIEESEHQDLLYLEKVEEKFKALFPNIVISSIHGKLKPDEKQLEFKKFRDHQTQLLISTSVVEVGISVSNATIMAVLNPERFGLSSLHQLRGRVGRGEKQGFCFLINDRSISTDSMARLKVIENCSDGFQIAEEDLKIRGHGDLYGTNQSGAEGRKQIANIVLHADFLEMARKDVDSLAMNPDFENLNSVKKIMQEKQVFLTI